MAGEDGAASCRFHAAGALALRLSPELRQTLPREGLYSNGKLPGDELSVVAEAQIASSREL
jgi:hypothetical protein